MASALDLAKQRSGLNKPDNPNPNSNQVNIQSNAVAQMEAAIAKVADIDTQEMLRSKVREMKAEFDLGTREKEAKSRQMENRRNGDEEGDSSEKPSRMEEIASTLLLLVNNKVDGRIIGQFIQAMISPNPTLNMGGLQTGSPQGITVADMLAVADRISASKPQTDPAIAEILASLREEIKAVKAQGFKPSGAIMVQQPDGSFLKVADSDQTMVIPRQAPPPTGNSAAFSLEEKKLEYAHEEAKEKIAADKERSRAITDALAAIPEKIGEGLAAMANAREEAGPVARTPVKSQSVQVFKCQTEGCNTDIQVPVGTKKIKCPKCGQEYAGE